MHGDVRHRARCNRRFGLPITSLAFKIAKYVDTIVPIGNFDGSKVAALIPRKDLENLAKNINRGLNHSRHGYVKLQYFNESTLYELFVLEDFDVDLDAHSTDERYIKYRKVNIHELKPEHIERCRDLLKFTGNDAKFTKRRKFNHSDALQLS